MGAIDGGDVRVYDRDGVVVLAARELAAAVHHPARRDTGGAVVELVADDDVVATFPSGAVPLADEAGDRWESTEAGWFTSVVEHGHWVYVFEADLDGLAVLDGTRRCQPHGGDGEVRVDHVEAVWHCVPAELYRSLFAPA